MKSDQGKPEPRAMAPTKEHFALESGKLDGPNVASAVAGKFVRCRPRESLVGMSMTYCRVSRLDKRESDKAVADEDVDRTFSWNK